MPQSRGNNLILIMEVTGRERQWKQIMKKRIYFIICSSPKPLFDIGIDFSRLSPTFPGEIFVYKFGPVLLRWIMITKVRNLKCGPALLWILWWWIMIRFVRNLKRKCATGESNPGQYRGRVLWYHYTSCALSFVTLLIIT